MNKLLGGMFFLLIIPLPFFFKPEPVQFIGRETVGNNLIIDKFSNGSETWMVIDNNGNSNVYYYNKDTAKKARLNNSFITYKKNADKKL